MPGGMGRRCPSPESSTVEVQGCVRACGDGFTALEVAAEFDPEVCLLDLAMPGMDGIELATRLRASAGPRPMLLVATTALGDPEIRARAVLAGFHGYLVKPVDVPALVDILARMSQIVAPRDDADPFERPDDTLPQE